MPTFATPNPIDLAINLQVGRIDVVASDRSDTVVTVKPSSGRPNDIKAVDETKISLDGDRLTVIGPKPKISWIGPNSGDSVDITVELPTGSRLAAEIAVGNLSARGELGATRVKSATGNVDIDATADVWLRASHGTITVTKVGGGADITAAHGEIRVDSIAGDALLKSSYGGVKLGEVGGDLETKLSYGDLTIGTSRGSVTAKTAFGTTQIGEVSSGSVQVDSGFGAVILGIRNGASAWLDLQSKLGRVTNDLASEPSPTGTGDTLSVRVRTNGDITVHRAS